MDATASSVSAAVAGVASSSGGASDADFAGEEGCVRTGGAGTGGEEDTVCRGSHVEAAGKVPALDELDSSSADKAGWVDDDGAKGGSEGDEASTSGSSGMVASWSTVSAFGWVRGSMMHLMPLLTMVSAMCWAIA